MNIQIGDIIKSDGENRIIKVCGFSEGHKFIPDGWIIGHDGGYVNPEHWRKYEGATSVLTFKN